MKTFLTVAMLIGASAFVGAQERLTDQLRKGIVQEEVNQNLPKAIEAYQAIVAQFDEQRKTAASALFRLAECSRKAGKREQAIAAYQRVVREFVDQGPLVESSRRQLTTTFGLSNAAGARGRASSVGDASSREQADANLKRAQEQKLEQKRQLAPEFQVDAERTTTSPEETRILLNAQRQRLAEAQQRMQVGLLSPGEVRALQTELELTNARYQEQVKQREQERMARQDAIVLTQRMIKSVEAEIALIQERITATEKRIQAGELANNPDLLQLRREVLGLERKLDELRAGLKR